MPEYIHVAKTIWKHKQPMFAVQQGLQEVMTWVVSFRMPVLDEALVNLVLKVHGISP